MRNSAIDAHVHLWTNDFSRYPLAPEFKPSDLVLPRFTAKDSLVEAQRNHVGRIVLVQMSYYGFDNRMMLDAIARAPDIFRGIAVIDHEQSHPEVTMRELAQAGIRGFRIVALAGSTNPLGRPGLERMFACGARDNLALCFLTSPDMLPGIDRLCGDFPETPVVVDHMARIGMDGQIRARDVDALCRLARHPKTAVKVSAFYALGRKRPPHDDLAPLIRSLTQAFGASRLMWASDSPLQLIDETYRDSIALVRDRLSFLTGEDKEQMLRGTAERIFFR